MHEVKEPEQNDLEDIFRLKYGNPDKLGWGPAMRRRFSYYNPDDYYEALLSKLVVEGCSWLDIGCGRILFPSNRPLARILADRCGILVGVDPDSTIAENPFVHERVCTSMENFSSERTFDLITMRMVAEHVQNPPQLVSSLARCTHPGSLVVIYTVNAWSPIPLITRLVPFALHHPVKRFLWHTEKKDTFPTAFHMNTRRCLRQLLGEGGFQEAFFAYLDDCRTLARFRPLLFAELVLHKAFQVLSLAYPENCLLGVYRRQNFIPSPFERKG
jgi:2-polyprenyl-3-methyl-5-hydroxy-6-metoxy-1,4-benzoquinol methylase